MNSISFKIKNLRENYKTYLSQEDLALELDTKQSVISRIESGATEKIDFLLMQKVCEFFNVEPKYFLEDGITQNNTENNNSAISIFGNPTVNNSIPDSLLETLIANQNQITTLIETQNKLIDGFLKR